MARPGRKRDAMAIREPSGRKQRPTIVKHQGRTPEQRAMMLEVFGHERDGWDPEDPLDYLASPLLEAHERLTQDQRMAGQKFRRCYALNQAVAQSPRMMVKTGDGGEEIDAERAKAEWRNLVLAIKGGPRIGFVSTFSAVSYTLIDKLYKSHMRVALFTGLQRAAVFFGLSEVDVPPQINIEMSLIHSRKSANGFGLASGKQQ